MKNAPSSPSATKPRLQSISSRDQRFTIAFWMMKYETFLFHTAPYSTYERYTRALDKLFSHFAEKRFLHEFRRADLEDFKKQRLDAGISVKTVGIELSCIRSFWDFLLRMEADGIFFNPVRGVSVKKESKKRRLLDGLAEGYGGQTSASSSSRQRVEADTRE
jgi:site-specific recombinase XerD